MKKLLALLLLLPSIAWAQIDPVIVGGTPVRNGTDGQCLTIAGGRLGSSICAGAATSVTVGTTAVAGGNSGRVLYDNAGVLGELTTTGNGAVALGTGATLNQPNVFWSTSSAVTAAGTNQGTATALTSVNNIVTTVSSGTGVVLPTGAAGQSVAVYNKGANALNVYPASGASIDALSTNVAYSLAAGGTIVLNATSSTKWYSSAPGGLASLTTNTFSGVQLFASGTEAAPGQAFSVAPNVGIFHSTNGTFGDAMSITVKGKEQAEFIRRDAVTTGTFENSWLLLGGGDDVTYEAQDTYIATIGVQSFNWSGTNSRPVAINIGSVNATITDTITKPGVALMTEMDKLDIYQSAGPVTVTKAAGVRIRSPIPHPGVTLTTTVGLMFTDPSGAITGTVGEHRYIEIPPTAGGANGPTTTVGLFYNDKPSGGSVSTDGGVEYWINGKGAVTINGGTSQDVNITAGTASNAGTATLKGASTNIDTRITSGRVLLKNAGNTVVEVGNTGGNWIVLDAAGTPVIRPNHASNANIGLNISSKGTSSLTFFTGNGAYQQVEVQDTTSAANRLQLTGAVSGANPRIKASAENLVFGGASALVAGATAGFVGIPVIATTPSGVPTGAGSGTAFIAYDNTNNKLQVYSNGAWHSVAFTTP